MAKDKDKHIPEETERQRSAQFGRIAAWTDPQPKRPSVEDEREDEAEAS